MIGKLLNSYNLVKCAPAPKINEACIWIFWGDERKEGGAGLRLQWELRIWKVLGGGRGPADDRTDPRAGQGPGGEKGQRVTPVPLWQPQPAWGREVGKGAAEQEVQREHNWEARPADRPLLLTGTEKKLCFPNGTLLMCSPQGPGVGGGGGNGRTASLPNQ